MFEQERIQSQKLWIRPPLASTTSLGKNKKKTYAVSF